MAALVAVMPPVDILPIAQVLELAASLVLVRDGIRDADRRIATGLVIGSIVGVPIGLTVLTRLDPATSSGVALAIILTMAILLLLKIRPKGLDSTPGLYGSGLVAGIVSGVASVGGLMVAVYTLALGRPAAVIRGTLIIFLFISVATSTITFLIFGIFTSNALVRAALLVGPMLLGLVIGSRHFSRRTEWLYRRLCLGLLIVIALIGLIRLAI